MELIFEFSLVFDCDELGLLFSKYSLPIFIFCPTVIIFGSSIPFSLASFSYASLLTLPVVLNKILDKLSPSCTVYSYSFSTNYHALLLKIYHFLLYFSVFYFISCTFFVNIEYNYSVINNNL